MEEIILNGQKVYFLSDLEWETLLNKRTFLEFSLSESLLEVLKKKSLFLSSQYDEIKVGLVLLGPFKMTIPIDFLFMDGVYYRIYIQNTRCSICNWQGFTGKYKDLQLYLGTVLNHSEKVEILDKVKLPKVVCPNCSNYNFEDSIWISY